MEKGNSVPDESYVTPTGRARVSRAVHKAETDTERALLDAAAARRAASRTVWDDRAEGMLGFAAIVITAIFLIGIGGGALSYVQ